ncbi:hypothetical protein EAH81_10595 [Flavobacterium pectinovorum]|uniref:Uncharacterized protein n=1 Tax=Flavobacterium pectinovorum TaxID=29533 RepID=A0A502EWH2_9FLAO|nr:hypothetical protein EAH81_10595 [Flavobacterium pectinovorum]
MAFVILQGFQNLAEEKIPNPTSFLLNNRESQIFFELPPALAGGINWRIYPGFSQNRIENIWLKPYL